MAPRREFTPRSVEAEDVRLGRVDPHYAKTLIRLLAAHALAEKLTALGYQRALEALADEALRPVVEKNLREERRHAALVYRALGEIGVSQTEADRAMMPALKAPSFEAPLRFARRAAGALDLLMASLSLDMTGLIMIGINYKDSSYAPHAQAAERILEEEAEHEMFGAGELARAVERCGCEAVGEALRGWLPAAVNFFGPPGSGFTYDCLRFGLKARDNDELAELYLSMLERRLSHLGIELPKLTRGYPHALA
ncbi:MAG TPA: Phenylacetic acid catabolic protein [Candidatus Binataceae bacterium]|jgi:1,2-phenylacetyl-CoA epoxidase catalytic subunit|nr:Phenylacetic acid catabolic protein [Candidatus Binataceae bacterium]